MMSFPLRPHSQQANSQWKTQLFCILLLISILVVPTLAFYMRVANIGISPTNDQSSGTDDSDDANTLVLLQHYAKTFEKTVDRHNPDDMAYVVMCAQMGYLPRANTQVVEDLIERLAPDNLWMHLAYVDQELRDLSASTHITPQQYEDVLEHVKIPEPFRTNIHKVSMKHLAIGQWYLEHGKRKKADEHFEKANEHFEKAKALDENLFHQYNGKTNTGLTPIMHYLGIRILNVQLPTFLDRPFSERSVSFRR